MPDPTSKWYRPVNRLACVGSVHGAVEMARSNTTPDLAQSSNRGVVSRW